MALVGTLLVPAAARAAQPADAPDVAAAVAAPAVDTDGQSITVTWQPAAGPTPDRYLVRVSTGTAVVASDEVGADLRSTTFSGLDSGVYTATVAAVTAAGAVESAASTPVTLDVGLLARWDFAGLSATAGSTVPDASGSGHPATVRGNGARVSGDELVLPGGAAGSAAAHVELPAGLLDGRDTVTVSAWLRNTTGAGNYSAIFFGSPQSPPGRYWLLNPRNPAGRLKSVLTDGPVNASSPWLTERGISPTTASRGVLGPATDSGWGLYTTVLEPDRITAYLNGVKVAAVPHSTPLTALGTGLAGFIGRSAYNDVFYAGGVRDVRVFTRALTDRTVAAQYANGQARADAEELSVPARTAADLELATAGPRGSRIRWVSSDPAVLSASGAVRRPTGADVTVTLTAIVSAGGPDVPRTFPVLVLADDPAADVERVSSGFDLGISVVAQDLVLPTGRDGVTITWASSRPGVIGIDGTVVRPSERTRVVLTATFARGGQRATRTFPVEVLEADAGRVAGYVRSGGTDRTAAVHLAYSDTADTPAGTFVALNSNQPVRYPDDRTVRLGSPVPFRTPDGRLALLAAVRGTADVVVYDSTGLLALTAERRLTVGRAGLTPLALAVRYDNGLGQYRISFTATEDGKTYQVRTADFRTATAPVQQTTPVAAPTGTFPPGATEVAVLGVTAAELARIKGSLARMRSVGPRPLADVRLRAGGTLRLPQTAAVAYSDGGADTSMPVRWNAADVAAIDLTTPGEHTVRGTVVRPSYPAKLAHQRADPDVTRGDDGKYYLTASYPQVGNDPEGYDRVVLRRADTIAGLTDAREVVLWDEANSALQRYVWAPELTKIGGTWYILFTASRSANVFDIRPMLLRHTGGDLMDPGTWVEEGPMLAAPGDRAFTSFSLDMTHFEHAGRHYVVWAQTVPDSSLLIAEIDPDRPRQLLGPAVTISTPGYAWEGNAATRQQIDEGPAVLERAGKLYLTFSASTVDDKYCVGLLTADAGADLLDAASWRKTGYPLLTTADLPAGESGPGHNSFTVDEYGNPVLVYHSRTIADTTDGGLTDPSRHARARTVHFGGDGAPRLNLTADEELAADQSEVRVRVVVTDAAGQRPGAPQRVAANPVTSTGATISWSAPADQGSDPVTGYRVQVTRGDRIVATREVTGTELVVGGLEPGTSYTATVEARNAVGYGPAGSPAVFSTAGLPNPVARYPLDSDLRDSFGSRPASAVGTVTFDDGLTLPGSTTSRSGYVRLPAGLLPTGSPELTVSLWVRSDSPPRNQAAVSFGTPPVDGLPTNYWLLNPTGPASKARSVLTVGVDRAQPWRTEVEVTGPETASRRGTWVHYATVFRAGSMTSFVDGAKVGTVATSRTFADFTALGAVEGYLGRSGYLEDPAFTGSLRDLQIFGTALRDDEVAAVARQDGFVLEQALRTLSLGDTAAVSADLVLPTTLAGGVTVQWQSSDPGTITPDGRVTPGPAPRTVTLTATLTRGTRSMAKTFEVTVQGLADRVAALAERLVLPGTLVSGDRLPGSSQESLPAGVSARWRTSSAGLTVRDGRVHTDAVRSGVLTVELTAAGVAAVRKSFPVRVLPAADAEYLLGYTRTPGPVQEYGPNLAHSLHLALGASAPDLAALNRNTGILYARAVPTATREVNEVRTLVDPFLFRTADGGWGVVATRTRSGGTPDATAATSLLLFTSPDLVRFTEVGPVTVNPAGTGVRAPQARWDSAAKRYVVSWRTVAGAAQYAVGGSLSTLGAPRSGAVVTADPAAATAAAGAVPGNAVVVDRSTARTLRDRYGRVHNTGVRVAPVKVTAGRPLDLDRLRAELAYSDGSTATRAVDWDPAALAAVRTAVPGTYRVTGTVRQPDLPFPFVAGRADPAVVSWQGRYLFTGTDENGQANVLVRTAPTLAGLRTAADHEILRQSAALPGPLWAPELHVIGKDLYLFVAAGVGSNCWCTVQSHVLKLEGDDPTDPADWGAPKLVTTRSGGRLQLDADHPGISLDMTYWEDVRAGRRTGYVAWSQRYLANGVTGDAQLWVATVNPADPSRLTSDPVLLTSAEYGWDRNTAAVAEAPYVTRHGDTLVLTYSGSATDSTYVVGMLTARAGDDLLDPARWTKSARPVLAADPSTGQLGPGHSMFALDEDGNEVLVYHARNRGGSRDAAIRRVHWAADGRPILDLTADEEVAPANRRVTAVVEVRPGPDVTAPNLVVTLTPGSGVRPGRPIPARVRARAEDPVVVGQVRSGLARIEYRLGSGAWRVYRTTVTVAVSVSHVTFRAVDRAGNVRTSKSYPVRPDPRNPGRR